MISNSKNELSHFNQEYSNDEIMNLITNAYELLEQDFEEEEKDIENINENLEEDSVIYNDDNNHRYILNIDEIIDLKNQLLIREPIIIVENSENIEENSENEESEDYNLANLIGDIINLKN